jgi:hypothetical protein
MAESPSHSTSSLTQLEDHNKEDTSTDACEHKSTADLYLVLFDADDLANPKVSFSPAI